MAHLSRVFWQRKDGSTATAHRVSFVDTEGKKRFRQFQSIRKARRFMETVSTYREEIAPKGKDVPFRTVALEWFAESKLGLDGKEPIAAATEAAYDTALRVYILPFLGEASCAELDRQKLVEFRDHLLSSGMSRVYARNTLTVCKTALGYAIRIGAISVDPRVGVSVRRTKEERIKAKHFELHSKDEMRRILDAAQRLQNSPRKTIRDAWAIYGPLVFLAVHTGMRKSELRGLTWEHVDLGRQRVTVAQRLDIRGGLGTPKSVAGHRTIVIPRMVCKILEGLPRNGPFLFHNRKGRPICAANFQSRAWKVVQAEAGVPYRKFHSVRHFYASVMIAEGCSLKLLTTRLGHSNVAFTLQTYGHLFDDRETAANETALVEAAFSTNLEAAYRQVQ